MTICWLTFACALMATPALARMSGRTITPFSARMRSPSGVIGPLASSSTTLARTEAERGQVSMGRLDLAELAGSVVRDAAFEAAPQGKRVELRTPAGPLETEGNAELLRSALENVVRNAVRHTAPGSAVEVTADREEGGTRLRLRVRFRVRVRVRVRFP